MSKTVVRIENGDFAVAVVDRAAVGYSDTWLAPGGKAVDEVTVADYGVGVDAWHCQINQMRVTSTPSTTTETVEATLCDPAEEVPNPSRSAYGCDIGAFQDITLANGLSRFSFEHDTEECYVFMGFVQGGPPRAIGRVRMASLPIGGVVRTRLLDTVSWPFTSKPQIEFGTDADTAIVPPTVGAVAAESDVDEDVTVDEGAVEPQPA